MSIPRWKRKAAESGKDGRSGCAVTWRPPCFALTAGTETAKLEGGIGPVVYALHRLLIPYAGRW